jgi:hypothetical protein
MLALAPVQWFLIGALFVLYVITCVRVARQMRRIGKNPVVWFFVTFFFTAIPASVVFLWRNFAWLRRGRTPAAGRFDGEDEQDADEATVRCPRCRRRISLVEVQSAGDVRTCPRCGSLLDEELLG